MREMLSDERQEGVSDGWEGRCKTPESDRGKFYQFVSLTLSIAHSTE